MPQRTDLPYAADEAFFVAKAIEAGFCTKQSLGTFLDRSRSSVVQWLLGDRTAPGGLFFGLLWHIGHAERVTVIGWLCELLGIHPGEVMLKVARDQVRAEVWGEVVQLAEKREAEAHADPLGLRRAA